ncbi:MAG: hypothetical protein ACI4WH_00175 [Oscillospiraceae bacterium]
MSNSSDTIELLKECNAGIKMGVSSINEVIDYVKDDKMKNILIKYKEEHSRLGDDTHIMLNKYHEEGKEPNPMAKAMSWIKTNFKISNSHNDGTIADLIVDGCNMGIKSLYKYLNDYSNAEEKAKDIAKKLINIEEKLITDLRSYL